MTDHHAKMHRTSTGIVIGSRHVRPPSPQGIEAERVQRALLEDGGFVTLSGWGKLGAIACVIVVLVLLVVL